MTQEHATRLPMYAVYSKHRLRWRDGEQAPYTRVMHDEESPKQTVAVDQ